MTDFVSQFTSVLPKDASIEAIQRYSVSIILNNWSLPYKIKCTLLSLEPLYLRRPQLALSFSLKTIKSGQHDEFFRPKTTRPEVSEADPGNQKVTKSKVSKLRPAHRNSEVNM